MSRTLQTIFSRRVLLTSLFICIILLCLIHLLWTRSDWRCDQVTITPFLVQPYNNSKSWSRLPDLSSIPWPKPPVAPYPVGSRGPHGFFRPLPKYLEPVMSMGQRRLSKRLLRVFSQMMFANGLGDQFILAGGTLVGTHMFHDFVPWDDDVDVFVQYKLRQKVQRLLHKLPSPYVWQKTKQRDKLFTEPLPRNKSSSDLEMSRRLFKHPWAWPFLDICYFHSNETHFWEYSNPPAKKRNYIPLSVIFPTTFRPLGEEWYPTPRNTDKFLRLWYKKEIRCFNKPYSHAYERTIKGYELPCQMLLHRYAQVRTNPVRRGYVTSEDGKLLMNYIVNRESLVQYTDFGEAVIHDICIPMLEAPGD